MPLPRHLGRAARVQERDVEASGALRLRRGGDVVQREGNRERGDQDVPHVRPPRGRALLQRARLALEHGIRRRGVHGGLALRVALRGGSRVGFQTRHRGIAPRQTAAGRARDGRRGEHFKTTRTSPRPTALRRATSGDVRVRARVCLLLGRRKRKKYNETNRRTSLWFFFITTARFFSCHSRLSRRAPRSALSSVSAHGGGSRWRLTTAWRVFSPWRAPLSSHPSSARTRPRRRPRSRRRCDPRGA